MRVLVTGATGRIGRMLCATLASRGHDVIRVGRDTLVTTSGARRIEFDDAAEVRSAFESIRPGAVAHFAGGAYSTDTLTREANETLTATVLDACASSGVRRFVLASSAAVYGTVRTAPLSEQDPPMPAGGYGLSKLRAEALVREFGRRHPDASSAVLRIFNVFGPGFDDSLVHKLRASAPDRPIALIGGSSFVRDYVHVEDVVAAAVLAVEIDDEGNEVVNVGSGVAMSNLDLIEALSRAGRVHFKFVDDVHSHSVADVTKAARLWGYAPSHRVA